MAVDSTGNVYVADHYNDTIRKVTPAGVVATLAGTAGMYGSADGTGAAARLTGPSGVAVDSAGNVYAGSANDYILRKITPAGVVTTLAGMTGQPGSADGTGAAARFETPVAVAVDSAGNLYVADDLNATIRKVTPAGVVTTLAGMAGQPGSADGTGAAARFQGPNGVAIDSAGNLYVADQFNYTIRKVTPAGVVTTLAGTAGMAGSADGTGATARFNVPSGVALDGAGNLYVADESNHTVRKVTPAGVVTTLVGTASMVGSADGIGPAARFHMPSGVALDGTGNLYVADQLNATIRKVTPAGVVTTLAGATSRSGSTDGPGATARFNAPTGVAVDGRGNVYIADTSNSTIRKIALDGQVTTLAGVAGSPGSANGAGGAERFDEPTDVTVDVAGNVYVADTGNSTIRKIAPTGLVTTLAGTARMTGSADGTGAAARFNRPTGVAVDGAGNVYVADTSNATIRKITPAGVVTTLAGTARMTGDVDGTGAAARFATPSTVAIDGVGNVYVGDAGNATVRKITPAGVVTTLSPGFQSPAGLAADSAGNIYVANQLGSTIHKILPSGDMTTVAGMPLVSGILLGSAPRFAFPSRLAIAGGSLVISDSNAILVLRGGVR